MFVVVHVKFYKHVGVNVEGIHYRIHRIRIEALLLQAIGGALIQIPKKLKMIFIQFYSFKISIRKSKN